MDRRYNKYWRLAGVPLGAAAAIQQAGAKEEEGGEHAHQAGDRLLFESHEDGEMSLVCGSAALAALVAALERRGARESLLYASLLRYRGVLEAGMPAGGWASGGGGGSGGDGSGGGGGAV